MNENEEAAELEINQDPQNSAIFQQQLPGAFVEMSTVADADVIRAVPPVVEPEPVLEPEPTLVEEPEPEPKPKKTKVPVVPEVVNEKFPAPVKLEALVFRSRMKNSQSVRLVQAELIAQGYGEAGADVQGWLCEGTQAALARYQVEHGLTGDGAADEATIASLFENSTTHYWEH